MTRCGDSTCGQSCIVQINVSYKYVLNVPVQPLPVLVMLCKNAYAALPEIGVDGLLGFLSVGTNCRSFLHVCER